jgi:hypothetical protein
VRAAIAGEPVDRIPLGFYAVDCDTIERVIGRPTYVRNKIAAQLAFWEGRRDEVVESYQKDTVEFFERLGCADLILAKEAPLVPPRDYVPSPRKQRDAETWEDEAGRIYKVSHLSNELMCVYDPNPADVEDFTVESFPEFDPEEYQPPDPSIFEAQDYVGERLGQDRYLAGIAPVDGVLPMLGGRVTGMMVLALEPEVVLAASRRGAAQANCDDAHHVRPYHSGMIWDQDTGSTKGPLVNPEQYRQVALPFLKERLASLRRHNQQILMHNCGDNRPLMDMLIEAGVQCYQSLQTTAGMELKPLIARWGKQMTFWGGVPVELLVGGSPEEVRRSVREAMEQGVRGRGFILGPSHSVAYGTKYDNFMAMLDEYQKRADRLSL